MRYAVITRHRGEFPVRLMCRVLDVATSGYYASLNRPPSWHALIDEVLMARVWIVHHESGRTYGARRVHRELQPWFDTTHRAYRPNRSPFEPIR